MSKISITACALLSCIGLYGLIVLLVPAQDIPARAPFTPTPSSASAQTVPPIHIAEPAPTEKPLPPKARTQQAKPAKRAKSTKPARPLPPALSNAQLGEYLAKPVPATPLRTQETENFCAILSTNAYVLTSERDRGVTRAQALRYLAQAASASTSAYAAQTQQLMTGMIQQIYDNPSVSPHKVSAAMAEACSMTLRSMR